MRGEGSPGRGPPGPEQRAELLTFQGAIFDVDGVLVDSPDYRTWRDALRELMETEWAGIRDRTSYAPDRFTQAVYQRVVAGLPRLAGARAALEYFGVPDAGCRARLYAAVKQEHMVTLIEAGQFTPFDDALRFVLAVKAAGIAVAASSSSKDAGLLLRQIRLIPIHGRPHADSQLARPGLPARGSERTRRCGRGPGRDQPGRSIPAGPGPGPAPAPRSHAAR